MCTCARTVGAASNARASQLTVPETCTLRVHATPLQATAVGYAVPAETSPLYASALTAAYETGTGAGTGPTNADYGEPLTTPTNTDYGEPLTTPTATASRDGARVRGGASSHC